MENVYIERSTQYSVSFSPLTGIQVADSIEHDTIQSIFSSLRTSLAVGPGSTAGQKLLARPSW